MTSRLRRSALYMPGSNARALDKARDITADALIFDLEDAVAPDAKERARRQVCDAVSAKGYAGREVVIRINALSTQWGEDDLAAACAAGPDAILLPKVESPEAVIAVAQRLDECGAPATVRIWAMMETPRAMLNALGITDAARGDGSRLAVLVMGTNDLVKETRVRIGSRREAIFPWLMTCLAAARVNGLDILDGVYNSLDDAEGFMRECQEGRDLGMDGKTLIHPKQIEPCNASFSPSPEEVAWARAVFAAFDDPVHSASGVIRVDGQMVERLHLHIARRILATSGAGGVSLETAKRGSL